MRSVRLPARAVSASPRRRTAAVVLGAVALVGLNPAAALADGEDAGQDVTGDDATEPEIALPSDEQVDQVTDEATDGSDETVDAQGADDAVEGDPADAAEGEPADGEPADETTDPVTDESADTAKDEGAEGADVSMVAAADAPLVDELFENAFGVGKLRGVLVTDDVAADVSLAGAVIDVYLDADDTVDETLVTDEEGFTDSVPSIPGETTRFVLRSGPEGYLISSEVTVDVPPCEGIEFGPELTGPCFPVDVELEVDLVEDYRTVAVDVTSTAGTGAVPGATFELWSPLGDPADPASRSLLETAASDAAGRVTFLGQYRPLAGYLLRNTALPAGYAEIAADVTVDLTPVDTVAEADAPLVLGVQLAPVPVAPPVPPAAPAPAPAPA
ncbi:MAG: hypothetical protein JWP95_1891, partial [Actinotalea sp.]|nr:hypothetical protein [Actinotalea sp.]